MHLLLFLADRRHYLELDVIDQIVALRTTRVA